MGGKIGSLDMKPVRCQGSGKVPAIGTVKQYRNRDLYASCPYCNDGVVDIEAGLLAPHLSFERWKDV